jgi:hypothetical protein
LVHQERQHHQHGKHHSKMLLAMPIVVLKVIALVFQRVERLIFDLPAGASTAHEAIDVARAHPHVSHPTEVLLLGSAPFPVLDEIDPHVWVRGIEGYVIDKTKLMDQPYSAVMPRIRGDASGVLSRLDLLEQVGMITGFDPEDVVQAVRVQGLDVRGIRTQTVFGDDKLEVWVVLAQLGHKTFGGIPFTIIFVRAIAVHNGLGHEWNDCPLLWMDDRGAQQLMRVGDRPVAVDAV